MNKYDSIKIEMAKARKSQDEKSQSFQDAMNRRLEAHRKTLELMMANRTRGAN